MKEQHRGTSAKGRAKKAGGAKKPAQRPPGTQRTKTPPSRTPKKPEMEEKKKTKTPPEKKEKEKTTTEKKRKRGGALSSSSSSLSQIPGKKKKTKPDEPPMTEFTRLWNKFRVKVADEKARKAAVATVLRASRGKLCALSAKHAESRVVQTALRYADAEQRAAMVSELAPRFAELAKLPYARHVALALLRYGGRDAAVASFRSVAGIGGAAAQTTTTTKKKTKSHRDAFAKLATHANGAKVADALLKALDKCGEAEKNCASKLRGQLLFETPLVSKLGGDGLQGSGALLLARDARSKTDRLLSRLADKALVHHAFAHDALRAHAERCLACDEGSRLRTLSPHFANAALHVLSSRSGTLGLCRLAECADAKTRKRFMKALKGKVDACADHAHAYLFVWRLADVCDDVVASKEKLLAPLLPVVSTSRRAARILAWFLDADLTTLDQVEKTVLATRQPEEINVGGDDDSEDASSSLKAAKKTAATRRAQLQSALLPALNATIVKRPFAFLSSSVIFTTPLLKAFVNCPGGGLDRAAADALAACAASTAWRMKTTREKDDDDVVDEEEEADDDDPFGAGEGEEAPDEDEFDEEAFEAKLDSRGGVEDDDDDDDDDDDEEEEEDAPTGEDAELQYGADILDHDVGHATLKALLRREAEAGKHAFGAAFHARVRGRLGEDWARSNRGALVVEALLRYDTKTGEGEATFVQETLAELRETPGLLDPNAHAGAAALAKRVAALEAVEAESSK